MDAWKHYRKTMIFSWLLFSLLYWYAATTKGYHPDEFYSWVYAERCTFQEILLLKDTGIGHPPLYHLLQKTVQHLVPVYHPAMVRLANYVIGSLFVMLLVPVVLSYKPIPVFCYALCSSAGVLDTFVFSRMWGLVCLMSLLLLIIGERYCTRPSRINLVLFLAVFASGLASDYNFIVLLPYALLILFHRAFNPYRIVYTFLAAGTALWILCSMLLLQQGSTTAQMFLHRLFTGLAGIFHSTGVAVLNFWFEEPLFLALLAVLVPCLVHVRKAAQQRTGYTGPLPGYAMATFIVLMLPGYLMHAGVLKARYAALLVLVALTFIIRQAAKKKFIDVQTFNGRFIICAAGAFAILVSLNPFFYRTLTVPKFIIVLLPFICVALIRNYQRAVLYSLSLMLVFSGFFYLSSSGVSVQFHPPPFTKNMPVIFQDEFAYATQYFRVDRMNASVPFMLETSFDRFCRVCRMGSTSIPFEQFDSFALVADSGFNPEKYLPPDFTLVDKVDFSPTWLDRYQLRHFTPLHEYFHYHALWTYERREGF